MLIRTDECLDCPRIKCVWRGWTRSENITLERPQTTTSNKMAHLKLLQFVHFEQVVWYSKQTRHSLSNKKKGSGEVMYLSSPA